jgi:hypothetical protein
VLFFEGLVLPVWAGENLRSFKDDAGLFDPETGPIKVRFQILKDADIVEVRVRDFRGQIVDNFNLIELRAGDHAFSWGGKTQDDEPLPEGRYTFLIRAIFTDGLESKAVVDVRIVSLRPEPSVPLPEPLPPKEYRHKINGSLSTFWRHNGDRVTNRDSGEARLLVDFSHRNKTRSAIGVLSVLKPFYDGPTSYNGSRAKLEQAWRDAKVKGVFREGLGNFDDPMKLFSDFQSERKKTGLHLNYNRGYLNSKWLVFGTEGDVDTQEQGAAVRLKLKNQKPWQLGFSYTYREAMVPETYNIRSWNHAIATDVRFPINSELSLIMELVQTSDLEAKEGDGALATVVYDMEALRFSGGYIDLGESFSAPFADPLHHVSQDARGVDARLDLSLASQIGYIESPSVTLGFFDLRRYSDQQKIREIDVSLRFSAGQKRKFFFSWFGREDGSALNHTIRGNVEHKWNARWASRFQANHSYTDFNRTWRYTLDTSCREKADFSRLSAEWIKREIDIARLSPLDEVNLRLDLSRELWGMQLQTRHSLNRMESGINFFGRLEYKPIFLHRYRFIAYTSLGNRAAFSFENQVEIGVEVRY